ncbi:MAG: TM2 domain-containing protein [Clostridia bacterium]|nr:TM2 domain-containing protein [Clostridia bacterium]
MNKVQLGMFLEQNKDRLTAEDLYNAEKALKSSSSKTLVSVLGKKTKSPVVTSFLATFFGWLGIDCFYLENTWKGVGRIITTIVSIALYIVSFYFFTTLSGNVFNISLGKDVFVVTAEMIQYTTISISALLSIVYIIVLCINLKNTAINTKQKNAQILKLRSENINTKPEFVWRIG